MEKNYYKEYYTVERNHWWFRARLFILESMIKKMTVKKGKILNIGPATGKTSQMLEKYGDVISLEYDKGCYEFLRDELKLKVINGSIEEIPFDDDEFDIVCAFDVIEHVENDSIAVSEMIRVCKNKGIVFISVPALMVLWSDHDLINHHYRRYKIPEIKKLFQRYEGSLLFISYFNTFLFPLIFTARVLTKIRKSKSSQNKELKSDFERFKTSKIGFLLYRIFRLESILLRNKIKFPIGTSILTMYEKNA